MLLVRESRDYEKAERNWTQTSSNETQKAFGVGPGGCEGRGRGRGFGGGEAGGKLLQNGNFLVA